MRAVVRLFSMTHIERGRVSSYVMYELHVPYEVYVSYQGRVVYARQWHLQSLTPMFVHTLCSGNCRRARPSSSGEAPRSRQARLTSYLPVAC